VLVIATVSARGRASGAAFEFPAAAVCDLAADHRLTRIHIYVDVPAALAAVAREG
jgi:hypothetical protein